MRKPAQPCWILFRRRRRIAVYLRTTGDDRRSNSDTKSFDSCPHYEVNHEVYTSYDEHYNRKTGHDVLDHGRTGYDRSAHDYSIDYSSTSDNRCQWRDNEHIFIDYFGFVLNKTRLVFL